ncbi:MAG: type I restriction enzyme, S subunit [Candidatus Nitrotoga sp. SPKER]|nr:MAG: type I restriction enzyme, S subunit [Candidatus Nitrotoga sp. SPKER]
MKLARRNLPTGWVHLTLEDVAEIHDNLREPVNSSERAKRHGPYPYFGATGQVGWIDDYRQDGEYILLGEDGAPFFDWSKEKAYLVSGKCWVNNHAHVLKGNEGLCSNRYLLFALNQTDYRGYANGTTRLKLTQSAMRQIPINLAPLAEQHRIVAKIEELFSELDKGIENLNTAREQLKMYRQALLKHAFEGKLTAQWREERRANSAHTVIPAQAGIHSDQKLNPRLRGGDELCGLDDQPLETAAALLARIQTEREQRYQQQLQQWQTTGGSKPKAPKPLPPLTAEELAKLPELPEGWGWVKLGELTWSVKDGPHFSPKYVEKGIPFISGGNIRPDGVDFDKAKHISRELHEELSKRCKPEIGDVLYTKGGTTGIARVNTFSVDFNVWVHVAVLKLTPVVKPFYLQHALNSSFCYSQSQKYTHGVGNQDLGLTRMVNIVLAICSIEEQEEVIRIVDDKMSVIDQLELTLTTSLQQAEALRQSILKKAFSGQLVAQDANDEPAAALLARIKAEKAQHTKKPKKSISRSKRNE